MTDTPDSFVRAPREANELPYESFHDLSVDGSAGGTGTLSGPSGQMAIEEDTRMRLAMAPKDTINPASLEITDLKPDIRGIERPNQFKDLFDMDNANIFTVSVGPDGKETLTPKEPLGEGEKLGAGDYVLSFHRKDGKLEADRQFRMHIPKGDKPMSVVFAVHGVMPVGLTPDEFTRTVPLAEEADNPKEDPFIVVWPQSAKNSIDNVQSYFWIADNTPVPAEHVNENAKRLGYKDPEYIAALPEWVKDHTNADSHDTWSIAGHSLGSVIAGHALCDDRLAGVFPNAFLINGTMMTNKEGRVIAGTMPSENGTNLVIFYPTNDHLILPPKTSTSGRNANRLLQTGLGMLNSIKAKAATQGVTGAETDPLTAGLQRLATVATSKTDPGLKMDNVNQDPFGQVQHYIGLLGDAVKRYYQLPKKDEDSLKKPDEKNYHKPVATNQNFDPNAQGPKDWIWSAESSATGKKLFVFCNQGNHMASGKAHGADDGINTAASIAHWHRQFVKQQRLARANAKLASGA